MARKSLLAYAWVFLVCGLLFVFQERAVLDWMAWGGAWAGLAPLTPTGPCLWLGLAGSSMTVIAWLSYRLSRDPGLDAAWEALLLSKAVSSSLFLLFAWRARSGLFAASAAVDGIIFLHLLFLRRSLAGAPGLEPRLAGKVRSFYEVWFARANDRATGRALWVRYELVGREAGVEACCAAVFFDPASGRAVERRWTGRGQVPGPGEYFRLGDSVAAPGSLRGRGADSSWDLAWKDGRCAPAAVVPAWLRAVGFSRSGYDDAAPDARFAGEASLDGAKWDFSKAEGCVGHVWGTRYGPGWWWAHAVFDADHASPTVLELLSAPGPLGTRVTSACLWISGCLYESTGPISLFRNSSRREGDRWLFRARFGTITVEGDCVLGLAASLEYTGPDDRKLICRNSKVSRMRISISDKARRELVTDAAAVEFVEPPR
ncbi:MAG: hypothetical protein ACHQ49_18000 [Elusimicrobiota bacterium]